ncbi:MAG TPA: class I SAM-dependent methyltransferase [Herpetosiphonaceae bacterium]
MIVPRVDVEEIGAGTGLLLFRIAPHCSRYWATNFSKSALDLLQRQLRMLEQALPQVILFHRPADDFTGIEPESFDMIVINSVIQYFPSIHYLLRVLEGAVTAVRAGGKIFVGDVRSFPLLQVFHASVQYHHAPASASKADVRQRVQQRVSQEQELVVAPAFFTALSRHLPRIGAVELQLKSGRYHNELTRFRYDVVLHVEPDRAADGEPAWLEWHAGLTLPMMRHALEETRPRAFGIRQVPNAPLVTEMGILDWLMGSGGPETVGERRTALPISQHTDAIDPADLWALGKELAYTVSIRWSGDGAPGSYDVLFISGTDEAATGIAAPPEVVGVFGW